MLTLPTLPTEPVAVPFYRPTGQITTRDAEVFAPGQMVSFKFVELELTDDAVMFDPAELSPSEQHSALAPVQGLFYGLIAVPFAVIKDATNRQASRAYVEFGAQRYALSMMFDHFSGTPLDPVIVGVYSGHPPVPQD